MTDNTERERAFLGAWAWRAETRSAAERMNVEHWFNRGWDAALAARPVITDEMVERAAEAAHYAQGFDDWGVANETEREWSVDIARAALEAAFGENHQPTEWQE